MNLISFFLPHQPQRLNRLTIVTSAKKNILCMKHYQILHIHVDEWECILCMKEITGPYLSYTLVA